MIVKIEKKELIRYNVQLVVLTGNNEHESREIDKYLQPYKEHIYEFLSDETYAEYKIGIMGKYLIARVRPKANGSFTAYGSKEVSKEILSFFPSVKMIICAGIACGVTTEFKIGDILISDKITPYHSKRVSTEKNKLLFELRTESYSAMNDLSLFLNKHKWVKNNNNTVHVGTFLSGDELIDNIKHKEALLQAITPIEREIAVGIEMEGAGLVSNITSSHPILSVIIKSVSDWGDGTIKKDEKEKENRQTIAATNAAKYLYSLLNREDFGKKIGVTKTYKSPVIDDIRINGIKMFFYRQKMNISYDALAKRLNKNTREKNMIAKKLREFECVFGSDNQMVFKLTNYYWINSIERILDCQGKLTELETDERIIEYYKKYFGKHRRFPTSNIKAVVFDFDGTLTYKNGNRSSWQRIWDALGYTNDESFSLYTKYKNHEINHQEWCDETARFFIEKGLTKDQVSQIGEKTEMLPGCKELFEELRRHEVKIFICSGSIDTMISAAIPNDIERMIEKISSNNFLYDNNGNLNSIKGTLYDFEGKKDFIEDIVMKEYHFVSSEIAFVGNSDNDIWAYLSRARTILINPNNVEPGDRKIWDYCLPEVNNLLELKPYLLPMQ